MRGNVCDSRAGPPEVDQPLRTAGACRMHDAAEWPQLGRGRDGPAWMSSWARRETPIFGSQQSANEWSDRLRSASAYAYFATVAATPSGEAPGAWLLDKAQGLAVGAAAILVTDEASALLKRASARERPNGQDDESMPSSHASRSAVLTELARRNMQWVDVSEEARGVIDGGLTALTLATGWARVEAGFHAGGIRRGARTRGRATARTPHRVAHSPAATRTAAVTFACSSRSSPSGTSSSPRARAAMAFAAAMSIASVKRVARASSAPLNSPGKT